VVINNGRSPSSKSFSSMAYAARNICRYFFISMMNAAISRVSLRLSGGFGIVEWGISRNELIMSEVMPGFAAMAANDGARPGLPAAGPVA
jgi:hypothetical protein